METTDNFTNKILCGDSLELIKILPDESVNLIITSPPYFQQREYTKDDKEIGNEKEVSEYIDKLSELFHECVRVTKKNGSIVFNIGDKYLESSLLLVPFRFALNILNKESVKLVNNITWAKLNPTPRQFKGRLVSSTEPFFHFVKSDDYYYNLDEFMKFLKTTRKKTIRGNGIGKKYFELIEKSNLTDTQKLMAKKDLNQVIVEVKNGKISGFRMKINGIHSLPFGGQEGGRKTQMLTKGFTIIKINGEFLKRDIIESPVESVKGSGHPAIYPEFIIQQLLILLTKENDIVLDPFIGSGTTAVACKKLGRNYIGFDINRQYCDDANERLKIIKKENCLMEWII
ncbi:MAG: DNA modification methylase [Candidatus Altiarchaeales archaeon HGW-Altiarchaeales-1]|nr:MAG: DNA modification methylase [Candidatus Altiarchaeales archaeon HGW-Altiarchaeales-2]PKP60146.1 MAG: DNA modification methylase [Candidatus Altiarchaeales archaeon HGW-Altiarchaeales-1]